MRDPYDVLGVDRKASAATSKAPSGGLRRSCIPTPTRTIPKAASRFAEINAAYEILGDDDKRKAFDRGEIDAEGKPRFQGFEGFGGAGAGARRAAALVPTPSSRLSTSARKALPAVRGAAAAARERARARLRRHFEDILREAFGGAGGARARRTSSPRISVAGADVPRR